MSVSQTVARDSVMSPGSPSPVTSEKSNTPHYSFLMGTADHGVREHSTQHLGNPRTGATVGVGLLYILALSFSLALVIFPLNYESKLLVPDFFLGN